MKKQTISIITIVFVAFVSLFIFQQRVLENKINKNLQEQIQTEVRLQVTAIFPTYD